MRPNGMLRGAAGDLAFDQHRVDRAADVVTDDKAFDHDPAGVAFDPDLRQVNAIGVGHVLGGETGFGGQFAAG